MQDAIVIVLTLALAALVLWLPVLVVKSWAAPKVRFAMPNADDMKWAIAAFDEHRHIQSLIANNIERLYDPSDKRQVRVRPHMRKGRHVNGYTRRSKR